MAVSARVCDDSCSCGGGEPVYPKSISGDNGVGGRAGHATHHFPAVETAKQLIASLYAQLKSDKQYLVLRDTTLLKEFLQEDENFRKILKALEEQERGGTTLEVLQAAKGIPYVISECLGGTGRSVSLGHC